MSLSGFEALVVALVFLAPGALFLYEGARHYSPAMRSEYLHRQFPLELTVHYLLASVVIHGALVFLLTCILLIVAMATHNSYLVILWYKTLLRFPQVSVLQFVIVLISGLVYLALSLLLAYFGARKFRKQLLLPEPLWCREFIRILDLGTSIEVSVIQRDGQTVKGRLIELRYVGGGKRDFEILLSADRESGPTVWVGSEAIRELNVCSALRTWKFIFSPESQAKKKQKPDPDL
jgi:hypothetical protein